MGCMGGKGQVPGLGHRAGSRAVQTSRQTSAPRYSQFVYNIYYDYKYTVSSYIVYIYIYIYIYICILR